MLKTIGMVAVADLAVIAEMPFSAKRYAIARFSLFGKTISTTLLFRAETVIELAARPHHASRRRGSVAARVRPQAKLHFIEWPSNS